MGGDCRINTATFLDVSVPTENSHWILTRVSRPTSIAQQQMVVAMNLEKC